MSGMQGASGIGSMPRNCGMQDMHQDSRVRQQDTQGNVNSQVTVEKGKIPNEIIGNKIDVKI